MNETDRTLEHGLDRRQLAVVQVGQAGHRELGRQRCLELLVGDLVAQQAVVEVTGHGGVVHREGLQGVLHAVVARGLPDKLRDVPLSDVVRHGVVAHLEGDLAFVDAHHVSSALPGPSVEARGGAVEAQLELVTRH